MKKALSIFLHLGFWFCLSLILLLIVLMGENDRYTTLSNPVFIYQMISSLVLPILTTFYGTYFFLYKRFIVDKKYLKYFISVFLVGLVTFWLFNRIPMLFVSIHSGTFDKVELHKIFVTSLFTAIIPFVGGVVGLVIKGFEESIKERDLKEELLKKNHEIELALIKAQLDPHFLFNSLNNVDALISIDKDKASEYLNKLSHILRYILYTQKDEKIAINKEIEYIQDFIDLQKIRTSNSSYVSLEVNSASVDWNIEPTLFIPFIENAFKYADNKKLEDAIKIQFDINDDQLRFYIANKYGSQNNIEEASGLGLELIQKRLNLLYPDHYELIQKDEDGYYSIELVIYT